MWERFGDALPRHRCALVGVGSLWPCTVLLTSVSSDETFDRTKVSPRSTKVCASLVAISKLCCLACRATRGKRMRKGFEDPSKILRISFEYRITKMPKWIGNTSATACRRVWDSTPNFFPTAAWPIPTALPELEGASLMWNLDISWSSNVVLVMTQMTEFCDVQFIQEKSIQIGCSELSAALVSASLRSQRCLATTLQTLQRSVSRASFWEF